MIVLSMSFTSCAQLSLSLGNHINSLMKTKWFGRRFNNPRNVWHLELSYQYMTAGETPSSVMWLLIT